MIGQTISHYKILAKLGEGGMGVVYKALDTTLNRVVALKFLRETLSDNTEEKARFMREARAAAALDHPNIATIYEIAEVEGQIFIAMAYIEGMTLKEQVARHALSKAEGGKGQLTEIIDIALQIAEGLREAHEKEIVHRDIKSSNVMVTPKGQVKITDFGLAKFRDEKTFTQSGVQMGTARYMSPEQVKGQRADQQSDLFSFGIVLYEMLTGQLPFSGENDHAVMFSILYDPHQPINELCQEIPAELAQMVEKALKKDKVERYQHAGEILADFQKLRMNNGERFPHTEELLTDSNKFGQVSQISGKMKRLAFTGGKNRLKKIAVPSGIALILLLGFLLLKPQLFEQAAIPEPKPIAVISFENMTGDTTYDYLQKAIPNLLITSLEESEYLRAVTWQQMHDLLKRLEKEEVEIIDEDLGFELCRMDSINTIVTGSFTRAGEVFVTDVKVFDVNTKILLKSANARGEGVASILKSQIDVLSQEISQGVGLSERKIMATHKPVVEVITSSMEAYNYFIRGRDDFRKAYSDDARRFLKKAVALDSTFASAYRWLASVYGNSGDYKAMVNAMEKAKTYSQQATEKERFYIEADYAMWIERNREKRISILEQMAFKYPKEKDIHLFLSAEYGRKKLHHQAIAENLKVLQLDPRSGLALNDLGYENLSLGEYEKAIEYFKMYASVSPGDANPLDGMAETYLHSGDLDASIAHLKEALAVKPDFGAEAKIGYIYALKEEYDEALKWIDRWLAMRSSPFDRAVYYYLRGFYKIWLGAAGQALTDLTRAIQMADSLQNERDKFLFESLKGWIYYDLGKFEPGRKSYTRAADWFMEHLPDKRAYYEAGKNFYLGLVNVQQSQIDSAKSNFTRIKAILPELQPRDEEQISFYYDLLQGEVLLAEGAIEQAIAVYRRTTPVKFPSFWIRLVVQHHQPFLVDKLGSVFQQKGDLDNAIAEYERLMTIDPKSRSRRLIHPRYHYRLAKLYEQTGQSGRAIAQYEKFLEIWKNADPDLPDLLDAKARYAHLKQTTEK